MALSMCTTVPPTADIAANETYPEIGGGRTVPAGGKGRTRGRRGGCPSGSDGSGVSVSRQHVLRISAYRAPVVKG